jgi:hypothetical protein
MRQCVNNAKIMSPGSYVSQKVVTDVDIKKKPATTDAWIQGHIGVEERRVDVLGIKQVYRTVAMYLMLTLEGYLISLGTYSRNAR